MSENYEPDSDVLIPQALLDQWERDRQTKLRATSSQKRVPWWKRHASITIENAGAWGVALGAGFIFAVLALLWYATVLVGR
jgi:Flp pilus assembly protein TadB